MIKGAGANSAPFPLFDIAPVSFSSRLFILSPLVSEPISDTIDIMLYKEKLNFSIIQDQNDYQEAMFGQSYSTVVLEVTEVQIVGSTTEVENVWGIRVAGADIDVNSVYCETVETALLSVGMTPSTLVPVGVFIIQSSVCLTSKKEVCIYVANILQKNGHFAKIV